LLAIGYQRWVDIAGRATAKLSSEEQQRFWSGTASEAYGLK